MGLLSKTVDQRMRLECGVGFRQLRTCRTAATMCIGCNDLLDHLVGAGEQRRRHFQANRLRHDQVNDEVELGRLLDRKIGGLRPPKLLSTKSPRAPLKSMKATVPTGVENSYFS